MTNEPTPAKVRLNDELGPVVGVVLDKCGWPVLTGQGNEDAYIRHYGGERVYGKAAVAAERERWRGIVEQLIACHDEPTCPAVALAREWLEGPNYELTGAPAGRPGARPAGARPVK
jgi:hypothetical protein